MSGPDMMRPRRHQGFTLVELMIALVLGLMVVGGLLGVLLANQQSYRSNRALSNVQDAARFAFELMARDIRELGMSGCGNSLVSNATNSSEWWTVWTQALAGYDDATADPELSALTGASAPIADSASIHVLSVGRSSASFASQSALVGTAISLNESGATFAADQIVVVCTPDEALMGQLSAASAGSVTFAASGSGSPGNSSDIDTTYAINSLITPLNAAIWYLGTNPVGETSLYRLTLEGGTETVQEMVRDVSDLEFSYHTSGDSTYIDAASVTDWSSVDAVRVAITSEQAVTQAAASDRISRSFETTISLRREED